MDLARDNDCLSKHVADLERIFRYQQQSSLVVKIVKSRKYYLHIWSLETEHEWTQWLAAQCVEDRSEAGLLLVLAKRAGEPRNPSNSAMSYTYSEWMERIQYNPSATGSRRTHTLAALNEKTSAEFTEKTASLPARQSGIRNVPFSYTIFKSICEHLRVHASITKTITRADVPSFTHHNVVMGEQAQVYNCRTSVSWPSDAALSVTHFPGQRLTYAMLYGCTQSMEEAVLKRLSNISEEACHPLLMPGIFAELELVRHNSLIETNIALVETKIFELDIEAGATQTSAPSRIAHRREDKRTTWLDLAYLRDSVITWNAQIRKMSQHACELNSGRNLLESVGTSKPDVNDMATLPDLTDLGEKIKGRFDSIHEEYEEKIRDCSMRLEGMAMATQWNHSETAVEMALATNRESRVMKSISLVTMIFLPGTFFATVFSMTFFSWNDADGKSRVSKYLWIYVVVTTFFTMLTVGIWYYFVMYRRSIRRIDDVEAGTRKYGLKTVLQPILRRTRRCALFSQRH